MHDEKSVPSNFIQTLKEFTEIFHLRRIIYIKHVSFVLKHFVRTFKTFMFLK